MAFGHAVKRGGFDSRVNDNTERSSGVIEGTPADGEGVGGDDQIKGGDAANLIDGLSGDDVIIAKGGNDLAIGGDGEDDLSGGEGNDSLTGAIWTDTSLDGQPDRDEFTQDAFSDDFNAEATFEENGTDTIFYYDADTGGANGDTGGTEDDGIYDIVDFSDTIDFVDPTDDGEPITAAEKEAQIEADLSYDTSTGELSYQGDVFFKVYEDTVGTPADTVYVEVDGEQFVYDTANNDWDLVA